MKITPLDLKNQTFSKKTLGGYDPEEVHAFLNQMAKELEDQNKINTESSEKLKIAHERINYYKLIEKTLQDSVVTMQKSIDETKANAEKEAELLIAEAKAQAIKETERIRKEADSLRDEIFSLKTQKKNLFIRMRNLIQSQKELLDALEQGEEEFESERVL